MTTQYASGTMAYCLAHSYQESETDMAASSKLYHIRKSGGLCVECGVTAKLGYVRCETCLEKEAIKRKALIEAAHEKGICTKKGCLNKVEKPGSKQCNACKFEGARIAKERRAKLKAVGLCHYCERPVEPGRSKCRECLDKFSKYATERYKEVASVGLCPKCRKRMKADGYESCTECRSEERQRNFEIKIETLEAYGGPKCVCCGEKSVFVLTLEHVDGNGASHRREIASSPSQFYKKLKMAGYPDEPKLVVLCFNCNIAKGLYGVCPGQFKDLPPEEREAAVLKATGLRLPKPKIKDTDFDPAI